MTKTFAFERSWGAEFLKDGRARFRLWAPGRPAIFLIPEATGSSHEMEPLADGWFELVTDAVPTGGGYLFELSDRTRVPDPAARAQVRDVHGPSRLVDPRAYGWRTGGWRGRPWHEAVIYELHTGAFSYDGTFTGVEAKLDYLAGLGITAIELMPVAQFSGNRGWGYDGVLLYAPHVAYGGPEGLKGLIDAAHERGLMVLLDVVYNHFGPDGNHLNLYAPQFFNSQRHTPWGAAIDYTQPAVRKFFIENALFWLEEYRFDGLRLDAIDQIQGDSAPPVPQELAALIRATITDREIHLTTEDRRNITHLHEREADGRPRLYTAEWNDDFHHAAHVLATGESDGYYIDYRDGAAAMLAHALATGYVYRGEPSPFLDGAPRGASSDALPPVAFINFLQNHDQIGNRAFGERLTLLAKPQAIDALTAVLLLSPHIPLLFMGEEWGDTHPFFFFTDFHGELGDAVRKGRRNEFRKWRSVQDRANRAKIPDPNAVSTFHASKPDWEAPSEGAFLARLDLVKQLLDLRRREIVPRLEGVGGDCTTVEASDGRAVHVGWRLGDGSELAFTAHFADESRPVPADFWAAEKPDARILFEYPDGAGAELDQGHLPAWSLVATLTGGRGQ